MVVSHFLARLNQVASSSYIGKSVSAELNILLKILFSETKIWNLLTLTTHTEKENANVYIAKCCHYVDCNVAYSVFVKHII